MSEWCQRMALPLPLPSCVTSIINIKQSKNQMVTTSWRQARLMWSVSHSVWHSKMTTSIGTVMWGSFLVIGRSGQQAPELSTWRRSDWARLQPTAQQRFHLCSKQRPSGRNQESLQCTLLTWALALIKWFLHLLYSPISMPNSLQRTLWNLATGISVASTCQVYPSLQRNQRISYNSLWNLGLQKFQGSNLRPSFLFSRGQNSNTPKCLFFI